MILTNIKLNRSKEIILDIKKKDMTNVYKICLNLAKKDTKTTSIDITLVLMLTLRKLSELIYSLLTFLVKTEPETLK